jgi:catechol 2,3-dioxygenase-like lactoylglutathione lyase family enzyme
MTSRVVALCFDASDPLHLARFWAEALRWEIVDRAREGIDLMPTDDTRFRVRFLPVLQPKVGKNRIHLDLTSTSSHDQEETVERLIELGARRVDIGQGPDERQVVLADPEGNEFCVVEPDSSFLAGCGRLGSITCDGSPRAGYFWSAALGWPLVWDQDDETAIRAPDASGPFITWGPPVLPKLAKNRLQLDIAPSDPGDLRAEVARLVSLGASRTELGQGDAGVAMADPDGNEFGVSNPGSAF